MLLLSHRVHTGARNTRACPRLSLGLAPARANADWDDNSGHLGLTSGKTIAILASAATAGVVTLYLLRKHKKGTTTDPNPATQLRLDAETVRLLRAGPLGYLWTLPAR